MSLKKEDNFFPGPFQVDIKGVGGLLMCVGLNVGVIDMSFEGGIL